MAVTNEDSGHSAPTGTGCANRKTRVFGWALAKDASKTTAKREAKTRANALYAAALTAAETAIQCPTAGCPNTNVCRNLGWKNGQGAFGGYTQNRRIAGLWNAKYERFLDKYRKCRCRRISTSLHLKDFTYFKKEANAVKKALINLEVARRKRSLKKSKITRKTKKKKGKKKR